MVESRIALLMLVAGVTGAAAVGPDPPATRIERIENGLLPAVALAGQPVETFEIRERMRHYQVPGLSVAVIDGGDVAWARAYGVLERNRDTPVDTHTLFQAASISKPVVATFVLRSAEMGLFDLDQPLNDLLNSWKIPDNDLTRQTKPTLRQLLAHRAGLSVPGFRGYIEGEPIPNIYQILDGVEPANNDPVRVVYPPDTDFHYSGGGYVILQLLLTELHDRPLRQLMREFVLEPAGMIDSAIAYPLDTELRLNAATGHRQSGEPIEGKYRIHPEIGAGGLWTTATDLARWAIAIQRSWNGEPGSLLHQDTARAMLTPVDGSGLGPRVRLEPEGTIFFHDGGNAGYFCRLIAYADRGQGVVVMLNGDDATIIGELVRAVAKEYQWPHYQTEIKTPVTLSAEQLQQFTGRYKLGPMELEITSDGEQLFALMPGDVSQRLYAQSDSEIFNVEDNIVVRFEFDAAGRPRSATVSINSGEEQPLEILDPSP